MIKCLLMNEKHNLKATSQLKTFYSIREWKETQFPTSKHLENFCQR